MMSKARFLVGIAGCALATSGVAFAAAVVSEQFNGTEGSTYGNWGSDGTIIKEAITAGGAGYPISTTALGAENKVLAVEGTVSYADNSNGSDSGFVDMMTKASRPDVELEAPTSAQIAVAVDSAGLLKVYCKDSKDKADWYSLEQTVDNDAWVRVSLKFDYSKNRCRVCINGEPKVTSTGYKTADGTATGGSWYKLAVTPSSAAKIAKVEVSGCTAIDEVVLDKTSANIQIADTYKPNNGTVPAKWFDTYGLDWNENAASANPNHTTVKDCYLRCLAPTSTEKFELKSMTTTGNQVTIGLPDMVATVGRKAVLDVSTSSDFANVTTTSEVTSEEMSAKSKTISEVPAKGAVNYYRIRATDAN